MAFRWQIRHKLMIGLGLVVGIMALLLGGTLKGLASYRTTMSSMDSKLEELKRAQKIKDEVNLLAQARTRNAGNSQKREIVTRIRDAVGLYRLKHQETIDRRRDPDQGRNEEAWLDAIEQSLGELDKTLIDREAPSFSGPGSLGEPDLNHQQELKINELVSNVNFLLDAIHEDLRNCMTLAKPQYRMSMIILFATSILGTFLMIGLIGYFYVWVFRPVRVVQQGAAKLAEGDFTHRIEVTSGDEMEDLARAFNHMTNQLQMIYADLARQVNERSRQLVRSERLASVGFLAAGVAHEINNPLASIAFCSEALDARLAVLLPALPNSRPLRSGEESDGEVIARYLKMIQQEAFRCKQITERLLEFSRGGEKRREPTELSELVQSVLEVVQHLQNGKGKEIVFESNGGVSAWVHPQEIKSVVLNLVVNALDSMDEGGRLTIRMFQRDGLATLEFIDTGCGMSEEVLENIFEPFFTRSRTGKGTGLGLTISHRIICQHGGEIEAASRGPNQGSTFVVTLPLQPVEPVKEDFIGHAAA